MFFFLAQSSEEIRVPHVIWAAFSSNPGKKVKIESKEKIQ